MISAEILTGKTTCHVVEVGQTYLQVEAKQAFLALQKEAKNAGFSLQIASGFRDFSRQQAIWNSKFCGERNVLNEKGEILDLSHFTDWQKCQAILRYSALPGLSRHHWGTEVDVFDPTALKKGRTLQLEAWEYEKGGDFFALSQWLHINAPIFGFSFPFLGLPPRYRIGAEPWHLSYTPLSQPMARLLTKDIVREAWQDEALFGKSALLAHLNEIFHHYFIKDIL